MATLYGALVPPAAEWSVAGGAEPPPSSTASAGGTAAPAPQADGGGAAAPPAEAIEAGISSASPAADMPRRGKSLEWPRSRVHFLRGVRSRRCRVPTFLDASPGTVYAAVPLAKVVEAGSDSTPPAANPFAVAGPANAAIPVLPPTVAPRAFVLLFLRFFQFAKAV